MLDKKLSLIVSVFITNLICMTFFVAALFGFSQQPEIKFDRISIEQGLSENVIVSLVQDARGFIWIGSQDGLNRFDGYSVKVYRNDPEDPNSLSNSFVSSLYTDKTGVLWIGTAQGLNRFDPKKETFFRYLHDPQNLNSISNNSITTIFADKTGAIWVGTDGGGLNEFDEETGNFIRYQHQATDQTTISHDNVRAIFEDQSGMLWVGTTNGLDRFNRQTGEFVHYKTDPDKPQSISNNNVTVIFEDSKKQLWIGTGGGGLNLFQRESDQFIHYKSIPGYSTNLSNNFVTDIFEDSTGVLWFGTDGGGLNVYDQQNNTFVHYRHESTNLQSLSSDLVVTIYEDEAGILWFGTQNGISKFDRAKQKFAHYWHYPGSDKGISDNYVSTILKDRSGILWVGTLNEGLNKFDSNTNRFVNFKHDPTDPHSISSDVIYSIYEDQSGTLWIGTQNGGLNRLDKQTESFIHYRHSSDPNSLSHDFIWPIVEDSQGNLWIGTWGGGINRFFPKTGQSVHYKHEPDNSNSLSNDQLSSIIEDDTGKLWIGTFQGVNVFDFETGVFTHYTHDKDNPKSLSNNTAVSLFEDHSGTVWVGTLAGLNRFDREKQTFSHYGKKEGLPNEVITSIMEDKDGMLWVSTFNGISKFDPQKEVFENYDMGDGLQSRRFRANAHFLAEDGQMFFGGINGFNAFYPEQLQDNLYAPPVVLTDFQIFNQSLQPQPGGPLFESVTEADHIKLSYKDSVFSFEFASLHFSTPSAIRYAYKLEGFDSEWLYTDAKKRFATYTNIDGGTYTFRVKATNSDGIWSEKSLGIKITISSPFWKTSWFFFLSLCIVLTMIGLTLLYLRTLKHEINERKQAENALQKSEQRFRDLANQLPQTVFEVDMQGNLIYLNQMGFEATGYSLEDVRNGLNVNQVIMPDDRGRLLKNIARIIEERVDSNSEYMLLRKDGTVFPGIIYSRPLIQNDKVVGLRGIVADISDRKMAEEEKAKLENQLQQSQKMEAIGTLAGGIAHDFNNILAAIIGYTEMAKDDTPKGTSVANDLDKVLKAGGRAKDLVQQILTFSRQDDVESFPLQPASIVKEAIKMLRPSLPTTIEINQNVDPKVGLIFADPTQIHQIVMNLGTNAFHAMEETGGKLDISLKEVTLSAEDLVREPEVEAGTFIKLLICDSGPGMTPEVKDKIFDPYFTTKETGKGTGMGLSIVHGIVKSYGGFITLSSEPGKGTAFHIFLPVIKEDSLPKIETVEKIAGGIERILFIDDEEILADMGKDMLERLGYHVTVRKNSLEALETFQNQPDQFDIVITDQTMPGMTGADLARRMIQIRPGIPIILCTGYSSIISEEKVKSMGIREFAMKPLSKTDIAALIRKVLNGNHKFS